MSSAEQSSSESTPDIRREQEWQQIREALRNLRYGSVNIIVQDGVVVQIDRTEKKRLRLTSANRESENRQ